MPPISAWQHIYTNVEKEQSPTQRGGFQTLFYTQSALSPAEIEEMEARLLYFPSDEEPIKRCFFTTGTGKIVVARIVTLPDPDQFGRKGRYFAHSLIFAPEAFAQIGADPFRLFVGFPFLTTVEEALAQGDRATGNIPPVEIVVPDETDALALAQQWPSDTYAQFVSLAFQAADLAEHHTTLALTGTPEQVADAIRAVFLAIPASLRPRCTFDTYFYRCNPIATYYWAVGLPDASPARFMVINAATRQLQCDIPPMPDSAYAQWALAALGEGRLAEVAAQRDAAFALCAVLEGHGDAQALSMVPDAVFSSVLAAVPYLVQSALQRQFQGMVPGAIAQRLAAHIRTRKAHDILACLTRQPPLAQLLPVLNEAYAADHYVRPSAEEMMALGEVLAQAEHRELRLIHACWTNNRKFLRQELSRISPEQYRQVLQAASRFSFAEPADVVVPGRVELFLDVWLPTPQANPGNLPALVEAFIELNESEALARLAPYVPFRPATELQELQRLVDRFPQVPAAFRTIVHECARTAPSGNGLRGMLGSLFGKSPRK